MPYWNKRIECMDRQEIEQLQLENLQATLNRVYKNVRHYRKVFREVDFMPEDLESVQDIQKLPFIARSRTPAPGRRVFLIFCINSFIYIVTQTPRIYYSVSTS